MLRLRDSFSIRGLRTLRRMQADDFRLSILSGHLFLVLIAAFLWCAQAQLPLASSADAKAPLDVGRELGNGD